MSLRAAGVHGTVRDGRRGLGDHREGVPIATHPPSEIGLLVSNAVSTARSNLNERHEIPHNCEPIAQPIPVDGDADSLRGGSM